MWSNFCLRISTILLCLLIINCNTVDLQYFMNRDDTSDYVESTQKSCILFTDIPFISKDNLQSSKSVLNVSNLNYATNSFTRPYTGKKWRVGRVSRKQYEIINMLRRKTKIFQDVITSPSTANETSKMNKANYLLSPLTANIPESNKLSSPVLQTSTMSFIEFYYLDENVDPNLAKSNIKRGNSGNEISNPLEHVVSRSPLFSFQIINPSYKKKGYEKINGPRASNVQSYRLTDSNVSTLLNLWSNLRDSRILQNFFQKKTTAAYHTNSHSTSTTSRDLVQHSENVTEPLLTVSTYAYDKIKFFEIYDSNTRSPGRVLKQTAREQSQNILLDDQNLNNKMFHSEQIDIEFEHRPKMRYAKKHIESVNKNYEDEISQKEFVSSTTTSVNDVNLKTGVDGNNLSAVISKKDIFPGPVPWSNYSFTAVYVYERYQVHCDAAAISPHWLVASASCLSRHRKDSRWGDRTAFVTFCSENWWSPERITYVKYIRIHPRFHPYIAIRRNQYNIGVIQITSSMFSSCSKWTPIPIMSHQYVTEVDGSMASAIGWGLDRYGESYSSQNLPRKPLSLYENLVYSDSCPGNTGYSNISRKSKEAVANVFCLSLPPYSGENDDPVHGGLLLVGGKLVALYLQEERRKSGSQSAQYTGIWRLVPWVMKIADEPEEIDYSF